MPFQYRDSEAPAAGSIAALLLRRGDIAARRAEQIGNAQAGAAQASGNAWAGAAQNIGQSVSGALQQATDPRRKIEGLQAQQLQAQANDASQLRTGQRAVDAMMAGDQLQPGASGPRQESYLAADGLFDVAKLHQALAQSGMGHLAPELLKSAEGINASITQHREDEQKLGASATLMLGDMAKGALDLAKVGMPLPAAMDFVVQPALATKRTTPAQYAQIRQQITALPPEQQAAALTSYMDAAAKLDKGENLAEGAVHVDRYGRTVATGGKKPLNESELASDAATLGTPQETPTAKQSSLAMAMLKPKPNATDEQDKQRYRDIQAKQLQGIPIAPPDLAWAKGYEKEKTLGVDASAGAANERLSRTISQQTEQQKRAQDFQEHQVGKKELTEKVEKPWLDAQSQAENLRDVVKSAQNGNKVAATMQSLEATMTTIKAAGLTRMTNIELGNTEKAGSLWDSIVGRTEKLTSGQPVPPDLQRDMLTFADLLEKAAYKKYLRGHESVTQRYGLKNEKPVSGPAAPTGSEPIKVGGFSVVVK